MFFGRFFGYISLDVLLMKIMFSASKFLELNIFAYNLPKKIVVLFEISFI